MLFKSTATLLLATGVFGAAPNLNQMAARQESALSAAALTTSSIAESASLSSSASSKTKSASKSTRSSFALSKASSAKSEHSAAKSSKSEAKSTSASGKSASASVKSASKSASVSVKSSSKAASASVKSASKSSHSSEKVASKSTKKASASSSRQAAASSKSSSKSAKSPAKSTKTSSSKSASSTSSDATETESEPVESATASPAVRARAAFLPHHGQGMERKLRNRERDERRSRNPTNDEVVKRETELMRRMAEQHGLQGVPDSSRLRRRDSDAEGDLEGRNYQYAVSAAVSSATASATVAAQKAVATAAVSKSVSTGYWYGASSYYIHTMAATQRHAVLDALAAGGFKVVRIFVAEIGANNKGSDSSAANDMEPDEVGTYDDSILELVDQLMVDCQERGLKLLIALGDRYTLGYWSTDAYALQLGIVAKGSSGVQQIADASAFYTSSWAATAWDNRMTHALQHKNTLLGGKTWAELDDVVYAFEPQNEPQGHMDLASSTWVCSRAAKLQSLIPSGSSILVSSGGGTTTTASLDSSFTGCSSLDVISVHDYGTNAAVTAAAVSAAQAKLGDDKLVIMGEWGATGTNKAATVASFVNAFKAAGIPQMVWEVVNPGKKAADFEIWTDEPSWAALTGGDVASSSTSAVAASPTSKAASSSTTTTKAASTTSKAQWSSSSNSASWAAHATTSS